MQFHKKLSYGGPLGTLTIGLMAGGRGGEIVTKREGVAEAVPEGWWGVENFTNEKE